MGRRQSYRAQESVRRGGGPRVRRVVGLDKHVGVPRRAHRERQQRRVAVAAAHRVEVLRRVRPEQQVGAHKVEAHCVVARRGGDLGENRRALQVEAETAAQQPDERDEELRDRRVARKEERLAAEKCADLGHLEALERAGVRLPFVERPHTALGRVVAPAVVLRRPRRDRSARRGPEAGVETIRRSGAVARDPMATSGVAADGEAVGSRGVHGVHERPGDADTVAAGSQAASLVKGAAAHAGGGAAACVQHQGGGAVP
eukprot:1360430-Prymnesium_polylepis.2